MHEFPNAIAILYDSVSLDLEGIFSYTLAGINLPDILIVGRYLGKPLWQSKTAYKHQRAFERYRARYLQNHADRK